MQDISGNPYAITGIAFDPFTGILYGSTSNNSTTARQSLVTINPLTALVTLVGGYGQGSQTMADLTFAPDGTLYGWLEASSDDLYTINTATGAATSVGESGLNTYGSGLAANAAGTIFFAGEGDNGPLRTISPVTGAPTTVATLSGAPFSGISGPINAMAFDAGGTLYAIDGAFSGDSTRFLVTINTATGVVTTQGQTINNADALAFQPAAAPAAAPEPGTLALMGGAFVTLAGIAARRRRRTHKAA